MIKQLIVLVTAGMFLSLLGCTPTSVKADLTAENNAFDKGDIKVYMGQEVTIVFENKDAVTHNFAVYESSEAKQVLFKGEALSGPGTITYTFTAPEEPGLYYFQCDFHPSTMKGSFIVGGTTS